MEPDLEGGLYEGGVEPDGQFRELSRGGLRMGPGLRIPVPAQGRDHLLDQSCLTVRGGLDRSQMPRFQTESPQIRHKSRDGDRLGVVASSGEAVSSP